MNFNFDYHPIVPCLTEVRGLSVLVVDDEPINIFVMKELLGEMS